MYCDDEDCSQDHAKQVGEETQPRRDSHSFESLEHLRSSGGQLAAQTIADRQNHQDPNGLRAKKPSTGDTQSDDNGGSDQRRGKQDVAPILSELGVIRTYVAQKQNSSAHPAVLTEDVDERGGSRQNAVFGAAQQARQ